METPNDLTSAFNSNVADSAERLGVSVEEAVRILERKAADPDALSFMPGPKDVASREAYDSWVRAKIQEALIDPRPSLSHEEVMAHFAKRRGEFSHPPKSNADARSLESAVTH